MWRANSLEKTLMLGKNEGKRRRGRQRIRWLDSITNSMDRNLSKYWEIVENRGDCCASVHGVTKIRTWLSSSTTTTIILKRGNIKKNVQRTGEGKVPLQILQSRTDSLISTELVINDEREKMKKIRKQLGAEKRVVLSYLCKSKNRMYPKQNEIRFRGISSGSDHIQP